MKIESASQSQWHAAVTIITVMAYTMAFRVPGMWIILCYLFYATEQWREPDCSPHSTESCGIYFVVAKT